MSRRGGEAVQAMRVFMALLVVIFFGCGREQGVRNLGTGQLKVVCTTGMIADAVRNIGGDRVVVVGLMGPGVDPHLYKATASDIQQLSSADVIFYNGLLLEGKMGEIFVKMARKNPHVAALSEDIDPSKFLEPPEFQGHYDPHIWFDVLLWAEATRKIDKVLSTAVPEHGDYFHKNGEEYRERLKRLHQWCLEQVGSVPEDKRILITSHDAFNYFGRAYGFQVVGLQGISTVSEAGLADISGLVDFIREKKVPAIFVESSVSPAAIKRVSEDAGVRIGGELFSDAMGAEGTEEGTYEGMVRFNINTIVRALTGTTRPAVHSKE